MSQTNGRADPKPTTLGIDYKGRCGNLFCEHSKGGTITKQDIQWGSQGNRPGSSSASETIPTPPHPCCYFCCLFLYLLIVGRGHDPPIPYPFVSFVPRLILRDRRKVQGRGSSLVLLSPLTFIYCLCAVLSKTSLFLPSRLCVSMCPRVLVSVMNPSTQVTYLFPSEHCTGLTRSPGPMFQIRVEGQWHHRQTKWSLCTPCPSS